MATVAMNLFTLHACYQLINVHMFLVAGHFEINIITPEFPCKTETF